MWPYIPEELEREVWKYMFSESIAVIETVIAVCYSFSWLEPGGGWRTLRFLPVQMISLMDIE